MKKNLFSWMSFLMMAFVCVGFAACGGDDDGGNGGGSGSGSGTIQGDGKSYNFNNAYFYAEKSGGKTQYIIQVYNCDYYAAMQKHDANMIPNVLQSMNVIFKAEGSTSEIPTGEFLPFEALVVSMDKDAMISGSDDHGEQYIAYSETVPVKISKSGDNYTISFDKVDFTNVFSGNDHSVVFSSGFSYTGRIASVPKDYFSVE